LSLGFRETTMPRKENRPPHSPHAGIVQIALRTKSRLILMALDRRYPELLAH